LRATGNDIETMQAADVTLYVTGYCAYCTRAKHLLTEKRVSFTEINVDDRQDLRRWLRQVSGQQTVPQIFINGKSIGGFTELAALEKRGELDALLGDAPDAGAPAILR
jgi:glutaredoxin 3